jgi:hypothetical protein
MWSVLQVHVAAWGLFEKKDIQTLNRVASARTMDGFKIRAKLALSFPRPVGNAEAEDVMMQYARAFAAAVECELSNGDVPFEEHELHQRITDAVQALPKKNVKLIGLHVWHKGAISSRSMLAVQPEGKATVPAMQAVAPSQTRERTPSQAAAHSATTLKPEARSGAPESGSRDVSEPPSMRGAVTVPAPATPGAPRTPAASQQRPPTTPSAGPQRTPTTPAMRAATPAMAAAAATAARAVTVASMPAAHMPTANVARPPLHSPPAPAVSGARLATQATSATSATRVMSGVVPAVEPRIVRTKSGFLVALEQSAADTGDDVGRAMAQPIRDAAAGLLLSTLDALHGTFPDPLSLFDGRADLELRGALIGEACVCVCYVLYESLTRTSLPQMQGIAVVQSACVHALADKNMPVSEISRYLATESPREEFAARTCALLGTRETPELQQRVDAALRGLRIDVKTCSEQIEARLSRAKAAGSR